MRQNRLDGKRERDGETHDERGKYRGMQKRGWKDRHTKDQGKKNGNLRQKGNDEGGKDEGENMKVEKMKQRASIYGSWGQMRWLGEGMK